MKPIFLAFEAR